MYGGVGVNGDSGSISGPQVLPIRSTTGWTSLPRRLCVVSGSTAFLNATIGCGSRAVGRSRSSCQGISVRPAYTPRLLATANLRTPQARAASRVLSRPVRSVRKKSTGSSPGTEPARWTMSVMSWRPARARTASRSVTSTASTTTRPAKNDGTSARRRVVTTTGCPRPARAGAVCAPIMPSPPVIKIIGPLSRPRRVPWLDVTTLPAPDERTRYSSHRTDEVDIQSWPAFGADERKLLESAGQVIRPEPGEVLWDGGDSYDFYLVLAGGICLVDRRDDRTVVVIEPGDFVGELGMLMGQPAFLAGVAMPGSTLLRVRVEDLRRLIATSVELGDLLLS